MMLAVLSVAAARALAVAAAGGLVAADTHPPGTRAPATAAMASLAATPVLRKTNLPLPQGCDWAALTAGSRPVGEAEPVVGLRSWGVAHAGAAWDGQVAAGQPGPVQAGGPRQRPGSVDGDAVGLPEQFPHHGLFGVDGPQ